MPVSLDGLTAEQLRELIASAQKKLKEVEEEQKQAAISHIRELAAAAGLKVQIEGDKKGKSPANGTSAPKVQQSGLKFVHPDDPSKVYLVSRGRKPQWVRDLEAQGVKPR